MSPEKGYEIMNNICMSHMVNYNKEMQEKIIEARNAVWESIPKDPKENKEDNKKVN